MEANCARERAETDGEKFADGGIAASDSPPRSERFTPPTLVVGERHTNVPRRFTETLSSIGLAQHNSGSGHAGKPTCISFCPLCCLHLPKRYSALSSEAERLYEYTCWPLAPSK